MQNTLRLGDEVKRIVKQEKRNKELSIARICKHNHKSFYSYINERRIERDNIRPLITRHGILITTDNDMANTMNSYRSSVFTIEQMNTVPQFSTNMRVISLILSTLALMKYRSGSNI